MAELQTGEEDSQKGGGGTGEARGTAWRALVVRGLRTRVPKNCWICAFTRPRGQQPPQSFALFLEPCDRGDQRERALFPGREVMPFVTQKSLMSTWFPPFPLCPSIPILFQHLPLPTWCTPRAGQAVTYIPMRCLPLLAGPPWVGCWPFPVFVPFSAVKTVATSHRIISNNRGQVCEVLCRTSRLSKHSINVSYQY